MGYTTDFNGRFDLNKKLDTETHEFLIKLAETRRMARDSAKLKAKYGQDFGVQGEFFVGESATFATSQTDDTILDHNRPPKTQPGLNLQWVPTHDGKGIEWDGGEKFYEYVAWLEYLIDNVLKPKGYVLSGYVQWRGENFDDIGTIIVKKNVVTTKAGKLLSAPKPRAKAAKAAKKS